MKKFSSIKIELAPKNLLDCNPAAIHHHMKGTTDVIAFPANSSGATKRNHLNMIIELKQNLDSIAQTIGKVILAHALSHDCGSFPSPVGVVTSES